MRIKYLNVVYLYAFCLADAAFKWQMNSTLEMAVIIKGVFLNNLFNAIKVIGCLGFYEGFDHKMVLMFIYLFIVNLSLDM